MDLTEKASPNRRDSVLKSPGAFFARFNPSEPTVRHLHLHLPPCRQLSDALLSLISTFFDTSAHRAAPTTSRTCPVSFNHRSLHPSMLPWTSLPSHWFCFLGEHEDVVDIPGKCTVRWGGDRGSRACRCRGAIAHVLWSRGRDFFEKRW